MPVPRDTLLHISDLHFWEIVLNPFRLLNKRALGNANVILRRRREYRTGLAEEFAETIAATGVTTILITGDFSSTSTEHEFTEAAAFLTQLRERGMHIIAIPGNHDVYTFSAARRQRWARHFGEYLPAKSLPCRVCLPGGTPLVLAPTVCPNLVSSRGRITDDDALETARLTMETPSGSVIVAGHYPLLHKTATYASSASRQLRNAETLRNALGETGRNILYVAGHVHRFSYTRDVYWPNLSHLTAPALFLQRRGMACAGAFLEIHAHENDFSIFEHWREETWERHEQAAQ
jgi:hypothetical protein